MEHLGMDGMEIEYESESTHHEQHSNIIQETEPAETEIESAKIVNNQLLHYKSAENIIQRKCKEFFEVQEVQKNTYQILTQTNMRLIEQINREQKMADDLKFEAEKVSTQEIRSREEIAQLQQFVENAVEIKDKLQDVATTLSTKIKKVYTGLEETFEKLANQKEMHEKNINTSVSNIQRLKKALDDERNSKIGDYESEKKENIRLKQIILERKNHMERMKARLEEGKKFQELSCQLVDEKEKLENKLKKIELKWAEIQNKIEQATIDGNFNRTSLQQELETNQQRIIPLENDVAQTNRQIEEVLINIQKNEELLHKNHFQLEHIYSKTADIKKIVTEMKTGLDSTAKERRTEIDNIKRKIADAEKNLMALNMENNRKIMMDEQLSHDNFSKFEEKNALTIQKETASTNKQLNLVKNELLDEQIKTVQTKMQNIQEQTMNISSVEYLVELERQRTYLQTCKKYYEENVKLLKNEKRKAQNTMNTVVRQITTTKNAIKEGQKKLQELNNPLSGILKKDNKKRKVTIPPKTVQFLNISSDVSSDVDTSEQQAVYDKISADYAKVEEDKNKNKLDLVD